MMVTDFLTEQDDLELGRQMYRLISDLYPICRSITGNGVRETLRLIKHHVPLTMHEVPSGTTVFDWTVPKEWNISDAFVGNSGGERIIDFKKSNLHVVNYSVPVRRKVSLEELKKHLFTIPDHPDWIPYRTSYYQENWGFCLSHNQYRQLSEGEYEVCIDSSLVDGHLTYGELFLQGAQSDEVLISTHICHPSLCNDNLSGIAVATFLARSLIGRDLRYSYRFLFIPGTIGSITWLSMNEERVSRIKHGLVAACLGDPGTFTYKQSRRGDAEIDRVVAIVLRDSGSPYQVLEFSPYGYDERQYCSPGFDLPVGSLTRTPHGRFAEYHTSADDLNFVQPESLAESLSTYLAVLTVLENNRVYLNTNPKGEPRLGKRGLYQTMGGRVERAPDELAMLWVLNLSDGLHALLDIAERAGVPFDSVKQAADALVSAGLLEELER